MNTTDPRSDTQKDDGSLMTAEMHNDRTHDSTVDTDGKNHEAARLAGHAPIGPDEVTTTNATLVNAVPESRDGLGGFDSRIGGNHVQVALEPGYTLIDKGMSEPPERRYEGPGPVPERRGHGRIHFAMNHVRPARVIELQRNK
jgi:hypothetical protein